MNVVSMQDDVIAITMQKYRHAQAEVEEYQHRMDTERSVPSGRGNRSVSVTREVRHTSRVVRK